MKPCWNWSVFHSKSQKMEKAVIHGFHVARKWWKVESHSHSIHVDLAHKPSQNKTKCLFWVHLVLDQRIAFDLWVFEFTIFLVLLWTFLILILDFSGKPISNFPTNIFTIQDHSAKGRQLAASQSDKKWEHLNHILVSLILELGFLSSLLGSAFLKVCYLKLVPAAWLRVTWTFGASGVCVMG